MNPGRPNVGLRPRYPQVGTLRGRIGSYRSRRQPLTVSAIETNNAAELAAMRNEVETLQNQVSQLQRDRALSEIEPQPDVERDRGLDPEDNEEATELQNPDDHGDAELPNPDDDGDAELLNEEGLIEPDDNVNIREQFEIFTKPYSPEEDDAEPDADLPADPFLVAFSMWCELYGITRAAYSAFINIRDLAGPNSLASLPRAYATLKKWVYKKLPTATIHDTVIDVDTVRLPAGIPRSDFPYVKMYHFDKLEILKSVLRDPVIKERMYFGMQRLVDHEVELWESRIWGESALTTSGQCAYIPDSTDALLPGDSIVYFDAERGPRPKCGRVRQVCIDQREESPIPGQHVVVVEPIIGYQALPSGLHEVMSEQQQQSYYLVEDRVQVVAVANVQRRANVIYDSEARESGAIRVSYVVQLDDLKIRDISLRHELLAEAEQRVYGRQRLLELMRPGVISLPTTTFIDGFTAFRKTQFSILGVYMCPANLPLRDRMSVLNQFPLTLGPMGSTTSHAADILRDVDRQLAAGINTTIGIEQNPVTLLSFDLAKTGDMPQQNTNCALVSHRSARSCRMCHVEDVQRNCTEYDTRAHGRYLHREDSIRREALQLRTNKAREDQLRLWGLKEFRSFWIANQPAFLPNRMTPQECCHIFVQGWARLFEGLTVR
jgi:hypothetical protein